MEILDEQLKQLVYFVEIYTLRMVIFLYEISNDAAIFMTRNLIIKKQYCNTI